jgi:phosphatidylserine decarboxylase
MQKPIKYWDRYQNKVLNDQIYADWFIRFCYETTLGKKFLDHFFSRKSFNLLYGLYKNSPLSLKQIHKDIAQYHIDMNLFEEVPFKSYADFFLRKYKNGMRPFSANPHTMGAVAEGRILAFKEITQDHLFPVKGHFLNAEMLLANQELAKDFSGGPIIIIRLCPIDYHHFHYPDDGIMIKTWRVQGAYHSVNVLALKNQQDVFLQNERQITIMETQNFGKIAYIEVGAMCVGKIIQENELTTNFSRGERKGHFEFGASTVILLGQKNRWEPSADILKHSQNNIESFIKLGDEMALACR